MLFSAEGVISGMLKMSFNISVPVMTTKGVPQSELINRKYKDYVYRKMLVQEHLKK